MLENLRGLAAPVDQGPIQIPTGTPIALLLIASALEFFPAIIGVGVGGNLGGSNQLGTIEHDFEHLVTDIVGIIQHHQVGHL